jgi:lipopolysaccharide export system protein LptA
MDFDEHNQPQHGHMDGGVKMDSTRQIADGAGQRQMRGSAPNAEMEFTPKGLLRHVHMERGVEMESQSVTEAANGPLRVKRTWKSPLADVDFRDNGKGQAEPARVHGTEGVLVTGETQRGNAATVPSRLAADEVTGEFGADSVLKSMSGVGNASMEQTSATGTKQDSSGDRLEVQFAQPAAMGNRASAPAGQGEAAAQIQSATLDGHVILTQQPADRPGRAAAAPLHAWAGRAVYEGAGEWLRLTLSPRVEDGGMQMTAEKIDVSHQTGDAFGHGNVKATWQDESKTKSGQPGMLPTGAPNSVGAAVALGGKGPTHVISAEAQLSHGADGSDSVATFRGHARLWQDANSVAGPVIVLDRLKQTLVARSNDPAEPVKAVLLSAGGLEMGKPADESRQFAPDAKSESKKEPAVITVRGGDLKYSDAEHKAVMRSGTLGPVVAETATATSNSNEVELLLLAPGNHAGRDGGASQVDRMIARGHVIVTSQGRRGTGEQLVYSGESGDYVLTGTTAVPPRMTDPERGNVTGQALIFHSGDDSVSIDGAGGRTTTETTAPK